MSRWIPVSERLPDKSMKYVIFTLYTPAWHDVTDELPEEERDFLEETKVVCGQVGVYSNGKRYWCWEDEYGEASIKNEHIKEYTGGRNIYNRLDADARAVQQRRMNNERNKSSMG